MSNTKQKYNAYYLHVHVSFFSAKCTKIDSPVLFISLLDQSRNREAYQVRRHHDYQIVGSGHCSEI